MAIETTYSHARANLATLWDRVVDDRETVIIKRRGAEDIALIAADELRSMEETLYLLSSPENGRRLRKALADARSGKNLVRMSVDDLRQEFGLDKP